MNAAHYHRLTLSQEVKGYLPKHIRHGKYYIKGEMFDIEEDQTHEFKGHRNISVTEIPPWCLENNPTRSATSRNVCGFLNSGLGGTIYIGILDGGVVEGIPLTMYQVDHVLLSLQDTLKNFKPPVPRWMYHVEFIPVIQHGKLYPALMLPTNAQVRNKPHKLRTYRNCWCDVDSLAWYEMGFIPAAFVIEIIIFPVNKEDPRIRALTGYTKRPILPIFQSEDDQIYVRMQGSVAQYSIRDVIARAKEEVTLNKMPELMKARRRSLFLQKLNDTVKQVVKEHEETKRKDAAKETK